MTPEERSSILDIDEELLLYAAPEELALYKTALEIETHLVGLYAYMEKATPSVKPIRSTKLICDYIDALLDGRLYHDGPGPAPMLGMDPDSGEACMVHPDRGDPVVYNLSLHMPPRHGKSFIVSNHLPAYFLTKYPDYGVILASYEQRFAASWGEKVRDHLVELSDFFGVKVRGGKQASKEEFTMDGKLTGGFKAAGAGGSITGRGGKLLIVDDPIKNQEDALSEVIRQSQEDWWYSTFFNRRENWEDGTPARVIAMFTRWHEDDLRGRVIDKDLSHWCILNIPAICEPSDEEPVDPLGRAPGETIDDSIISRRDLLHLRTQTPLWFEAMYQGRPYIPSGNFIQKPFQFYTLTDGVYELHTLNGETLRFRESDCHRFQTMDLAASVRTTADYTVIGTFDLTPTSPRHIIVRDIERTRIDTENHRKFAERKWQEFKPKYLMIEKQSYGTNLINYFQTNQSMVVVRPVNADRDKVTRVAGTVLPALEQRRLFFPADAPWYPVFEKEVLKFPNATHDDMVDVLAYGCQEGLSLVYFAPKKEYSAGVAGRLERLEDRMRRTRGRGNHPDLGRGY